MRRRDATADLQVSNCKIQERKSPMLSDEGDPERRDSCPPCGWPTHVCIAGATAKQGGLKRKF